MPPSPEDRIDPVDMSLVQIKVADPVAEDLQSLRERGAAINNAGNLTVNNLKVTPDINAGFFHVEFDLPQSGATSVRVYNSRGRMLYSYDLGPFSGNFKDEVDLSQNGTGAYYLEIIQDDRSLCRKIVLEN